MVLTIYIEFSEDGQHIRKWSREPFEGGTEYIPADELVTVPRLDLSRPASEQGFDVD